MKAAVITPVSGFTRRITVITDKKAIIPVNPEVNAFFKYFQMFCCHIPIIRITAQVGTGVLPMNLFKTIIIKEQRTALVMDSVILLKRFLSYFFEG